MYDQLQSIEDRYEELGELLSDPEVISDTKRFMQLSKEEANTRETVEVYRRYKEVVQGITDTEELLGEKLDDEMAELAKEELSELKKEKEVLEEKIKILLLPKDPNDDKNIIMEIRGAAGGDEAALFAGDLFNMYQKYAEAQGWKTEVMEANVTGIGGYKEVIMMITGENVYSKLKYESGAHRVQRVPSTESQGRIHTSTATVVVMPEAEEVEIDIEDKDIRTDIYHASGAGGQHVNKTASAVRLTHLPTGIVVAMQDERSQIKNREKAMKILRARVYDKIQQEAQSGYKEVIMMITGENVYSKLKYESGAHRVQRVPSTESQGRIHTSTATVVVMPEAEEVEIDIEDKDIRTDIYHASGAGGQHVNKTASAVRLTHLPTGIVVAMQDERSQIKNREKAMKILRARVYDKIQQEAQSEYDANRKSAVGTGDRSERIRTYNFPQNRVTDHRIGLTIQKLDQILAGKLDEIVDALIMYDQTSKLEAMQNG